MPDGLWALLFGWVLLVQPVQAPTVVEPVSAPRFPVAGAADYGRFHHDYPATDVFARCGTPVVSPVDGTVLEISRADTWDPATDRGADRGGRSFSVAGRRRGALLRQPPRRRAPRSAGRGRAARRRPVGRVGHSGDARGIACHLHFGLSPVCRGTGDWRVRRGTVPPYRFLRSWQSGGHLDPAPAVRRWRATHGCRG